MLFFVNGIGLSTRKHLTVKPILVEQEKKGCSSDFDDFCTLH